MLQHGRGSLTCSCFVCTHTATGWTCHYPGSVAHTDMYRPPSQARVAWARNMIGMDMLPATDEQLKLQPGRFLRVLHAMLRDIHLQRLLGVGNSRPFTLLPLCSIQAPFLQLHAQVGLYLLLIWKGSLGCSILRDPVE